MEVKTIQQYRQRWEALTNEELKYELFNIFRVLGNDIDLSLLRSRETYILALLHPTKVPIRRPQKDIKFDSSSQLRWLDDKTCQEHFIFPDLLKVTMKSILTDDQLDTLLVTRVTHYAKG